MRAEICAVYPHSRTAQREAVAEVVLVYQVQHLRPMLLKVMVELVELVILQVHV